MLSNIRDGPFTGEDPDEGAGCRRSWGWETAGRRLPRVVGVGDTCRDALRPSGLCPSGWALSDRRLSASLGGELSQQPLLGVVLG